MTNSTPRALSGLAVCAIVMAAALTASGAPNGSAIPDFSGFWGRNSVDYEPPPSGPGPVMNKTRTFYMRVGDDANPILRSDAATAVRNAGEISRTGVNFPTPSNQCTPWSPPYAWRALEMQIVQQQNQVTILYVGDQQIRRVRLNSQHPARVEPSWAGDSVGHYEGDTLVIDTIGIKFGRNSMIDNYGTPYSESLHLVERIRLINGATAKVAAEKSERDSGRVEVWMGGATIDTNYDKGLEIRFTVDDPKIFTTPWSGAVTYRRALGEWEERVCADNPHDYNSGTDVPVPRADKPDF